jgi:hypothetical protein
MSERMTDLKASLEKLNDTALVALHSHKQGLEDLRDRFDGLRNRLEELEARGSSPGKTAETRATPLRGHRPRHDRVDTDETVIAGEDVDHARGRGGVGRDLVLEFKLETFTGVSHFVPLSRDRRWTRSEGGGPWAPRVHATTSEVLPAAHGNSGAPIFRLQVDRYSINS